jgi:uncharacterized protein
LAGNPVPEKGTHEGIAGANRKSLVDNEVEVSQTDGGQVTVRELRTDPTDMGPVMGREGRTAKAIRILLGAMGIKLRKRVTLEIDWNTVHPTGSVVPCALLLATELFEESDGHFLRFPSTSGSPTRNPSLAAIWLYLGFSPN